MWAEIGLLGIIYWYLRLAPYTKVEESFNAQAIHDIIYKNFNIHTYDHIEFPGPVPRSFIGSLVVCFVTKVVAPFLSKPQTFFTARLFLGLVNWAAIVYFVRSASALYPSKSRNAVKNWSLVLVAGSFHTLFYASRPLPNMFAFPLVLLALTLTIKAQHSNALAVVAFTTSVLRAELVLMLLSMFAVFVYRRRLSLFSALKSLLIGGVFGALLSVMVDSFFWRRPTFPELEGVIFNIWHGKSAEWGTEPYDAYFLVHLPNLLGSPAVIVLALLGFMVSPFNVKIVMLCVWAYLVLYSLQPHKELRFIIYVAPPFCVAAGQAVTYFFQRKLNTIVGKVLTFLATGLVVSSIVVSVVKAHLSLENYPGGHALAQFHQLVPETEAVNKTVYMDVRTCMTGATQFGQLYPLTHYTKVEDPHALEQAWPSFDYVISETAPIGDWVVLGRVPSFVGINRAALRPVVQSLLDVDAIVKDPVGFVRDSFCSLLRMEDTLGIYRRIVP